MPQLVLTGGTIFLVTATALTAASDHCESGWSSSEVARLGEIHSPMVDICLHRSRIEMICTENFESVVSITPI